MSLVPDYDCRGRAWEGVGKDNVKIRRKYSPYSTGIDGNDVMRSWQRAEGTCCELQIDPEHSRAKEDPTVGKEFDSIDRLWPFQTPDADSQSSCLSKSAHRVGGRRCSVMSLRQYPFKRCHVMYCALLTFPTPTIHQNSTTAWYWRFQSSFVPSCSLWPFQHRTSRARSESRSFRCVVAWCLPCALLRRRRGMQCYSTPNSPFCHT